MDHAIFLFTCIEKNSPDEAKSYLKNLSKNVCKAAVQFRINTYLLSQLAKANDDVPLQDLVTSLTHLSPLVQRPRLVSLLSLAVWKGSIKMVRLFLRHGADINAAPINGEYFDSTIDLFYPPIIVACSRGDADIVKLLLKSRVDVTEHRGGNCLMLCIKNEKLVRLLVAHGADVNETVWVRTDSWVEYQTLLQYATRYEDISVVKLLLDVGADIHGISLGYVEDAFEFACRYRKRDVVDLMIDTMGLGLKEKIEAYRLIGASWMNGQTGDDLLNATHDESENDVTKVRLYWTEAMELQTTGKRLISMEYPSVHTTAFGMYREPCNVNELNELMSQPDGAHMYAMLVREQILGSYSPLAVDIMHYFAERLAANCQYERAIQLYNYLLLCLAAPETWFDAFFWDFRGSLDLLCHCGKHFGTIDQSTIVFRYVHIHSELLSHGIFVEPEVRQGWVDGGLGLMDKLLDKIRTLAPSVEFSCYDHITCRNYYQHHSFDEAKAMNLEGCYSSIVTFLLVLGVVLKLGMNQDCSDRLRRITVALMRICSETRITGPLLSYAARDRLVVSPDIFNYLIQCSSDRSLRDVGRGLDEALRALADELQEVWASKRITPADKTDIESQIRPYVLLLLSKGAHVDATNGKGERLVEVFRPLIPDFNPFPYVTLQCLAARVVKRLGVALLPENVPEVLIDFVHIH